MIRHYYVNLELTISREMNMGKNLASCYTGAPTAGAPADS